MKNFIPYLLLLICINIKNEAGAQKTTPLNNSRDKVRCGTMESLEVFFNNNPQAKAISEQNKNRSLSAGSAAESSRINAIVTIPVVFHLVLTPADQALVTEADVLWQINKMNEDYAGSNADSSNGVPFFSVRGHSNIRFCLAKQDAKGAPTNGINRVITSKTDFTTDDVNLLKRSSSCGADAWDPNRYLNIWIARSTSLLGISTLPGVGPAEDQGVVISIDGFSNNPAYVNPAFASGRTLVHETGHYFGLYHIWGDETGCTTSDFRQLPGNCLITGNDIVGGPSDMTVGDTPNQSSPTGGCASGEKTDACAPGSPGIQYQNFMDYTDDACYSMFTNLQVKRMEWVLQNCRASLINSNGCQPVPQFTNDAYIVAVLNPGAGGCGVPGTTTFCNGNITPSIKVKNAGTTVINSLKIYIEVDGASPVVYNWSGTLLPFGSTIITLPSVIIPTTGNHTIKIYTAEPNGKPDERVLNDTITQTFSIIEPITSSLSEGFESPLFPPTGWRIINDDFSITWERFGAAGYNSSASARMHIFNYDVKNKVDILASPSISVAGQDSVRVSFHVAHTGFGDPGFGPDTLELVYSTDCGATWQNFGGYKKWSSGNGANNLTTAAPTYSDFIPANTGEWRAEYAAMSLPLQGNATAITIGFKSTSLYGNNIYLDNILIEKIILVRRDAATIKINNLSNRICQPFARPQVMIRNAGRDTLRAVKINYSIDNGTVATINWSGTLLSGATDSILLNTLNLGTPGLHTFTIFTSDPNNLPDQNTANDTSRFTYEVFSVKPLTFVEEGFSNPLFPPSDWSLFNPDNDITWQRHSTIGKKAPGSAWINNWVNNTNNRFDDLSTPNYSFTNVDSAFMHFNLSTVTYSYPGSTNIPLDTLTILLSKDCGNTFTPVYKKWGEDLQTINDPNWPHTKEYFPVSPSQWRRDSINLGAYLDSTENHIQLSFRFSGNAENNIFIDDVTLYTKTLPAALKEKGFLILPTVTRSVFSVWHYNQPQNLKAVIVYNTAGQVIWKRDYNGNAEKFITIDLSGKAAGLYTVSLMYNNKKEMQWGKVIKY